MAREKPKIKINALLIKYLLEVQHQQVYNSQVRRTRPVDPALLEQVGPGQYRLRAFPVPPRRNTSQKRNVRFETPKMHLWLTYQVMQQEQGWCITQASRKTQYLLDED